MKKFNFLSKLCRLARASQYCDVGIDRRLTVGSPSGLDAKWKQNPFMRFAVVLTLIFTIGVGNAWGAETLLYTLDGTKTATGSAYASASDVTQNSKSWKVTANTEQSPWRIGGKSITNVNRDIYSTFTFSEDITKVTVTTGATASSLTLNSVTLKVSSAQDGSGTVTSTLEKTSNLTSTTLTFTRPDGKDWSGKYFTIVFNVTRTSSSGNGYVTLSNIKFYYDPDAGGGGCTAPAAPTISGTAAYTEGQPITLTATCASGADASTTYTWYKGADWATASGTTPVQAAATGSSGYTFTKASCVVGDAGKYWCKASNGTGCDANNSTGYDITVSAAASVEYELVTSTDDLEAGAKYLIGNGTTGTVKFVSTATKANNRELTSGTVTDSKVTKTSSMMALTLGGSSGAWTFATNGYTGTAGYLNATSTTSSNYLQVVPALDTYANFSISFSEDAAVITCTGKASRNIIRNNGDLISCYTSGYDPVYLYKEISGQTIYLKDNANWRTEPQAKYAIYYWDNSTNGWSNFMTAQTDCESVWKTKIPDGYTNMKFVRFNPSDATPGWNGEGHVYNQTGNLTIPDGKDCFTLPDGAWDGTTNGTSDANWSAYAQKVTVSFAAHASPLSDPDAQCVVKTTGRAENVSYTRLGYSLTGWFTAADGGDQWDFANDGFSEDKTLHAHWTQPAGQQIYLKPSWSGSGNTWAKEGSVIFAHFYIDGTTQYQDIQMTGNSCDDVLTATAPYGTTYVSFARCTSGTVAGDLAADWGTNDHVQNYVAGLALAANYYYSITGWGSYGQKVGTAQKESSAYSNPPLSITFAGNDNTSGSMTNVTDICSGTNVTLAANGFIKTGNTFAGWKTNVAVTINTGGDDQNIAINGIVPDQATIKNITSNITLTAQWSSIQDKFIDALHETSGYQPASPHTETGSYSTPSLSDKSVAIYGSCQDTHYHFVGWITKAKHDAGTAITDGDLQTPTTATGATYYAVWAEQGTGGGSLTKLGSGYTPTAGDNLVIVEPENSYALYQETVNTNYVSYWSFSNSAATVGADDKNYVTLVSDGGTGWYLGDETNGYVYNASSNDLTIDASSHTSFSITWNSTGFNIVGNSRWLSCRTDLNAPNTNRYRMGGATSGSGSGVVLFDLYKYSEFSYTDYQSQCAAETCGMPTGLTVGSTVTKTGATISWTGNATGTLSKYEYAYWVDGDTEPTSGFVNNGTNTSATLSGLYSGVKYNWKVRKVCTGDDNSRWAYSNFTTTAANLTYSVPTGVSAVSTPATTAGNLNSAGVPTNCGDCWAFAGWTTAAYAANNSAPAALFPEGTKARVSGDATLYAVYKKDEFKTITTTSELVANDYYMLGAFSNEHACVMKNTAHATYPNDAAVTDVNDKFVETDDAYYIYNPSEDNIWKFTGTYSSGQLYNSAADKYLNLSSTDASILGATNNLTFAVNANNARAWDINSTNYLHGYDDYSGGFEALGSGDWTDGEDISAYIYRRQSVTYATSPSCPRYTVIFQKGDATHDTKYVTACARFLDAIPASNPADDYLTCATKFMGWSADVLTGTGNDAPADLFNDVADAPEITADNTIFHAVFASVDTENDAPASITSTFTTTAWGDANSSWTSDKNATNTGDTKGVQVNKAETGAGATTNDSYNKVTSVVITYGTASSAEGSIAVSVGGTAMTLSSGSISGSQTDETLTFTPTAPATSLTGVVSFVATVTNKSIYIKSIQINYKTNAYKDYMTKCCADPELTVTDEGDDDNITLVREDIHGVHGENGSATDEQGKATLVLDYTTLSSGTCTVEVKKLTGANNRATDGGSDCSNHTNIAINTSTKKITFEVWTYAGSYPTANGQGTYRIKISQAAASTYCDAVTYYFVDVTLRDKFVDAVNGNTTINVDGQSKTTSDYSKTPTESSLDADKNDDCHSTTRRLLGWVREDNMNTWYGSSSDRTANLDDKSADAALVAPNADIITTGSTWYAVWGEEVK